MEEEKDLEYFCDWLMENNIMILKIGGGRGLWSTNLTGSKQFTTEQLVKKYCNEESL